MGAKVTLVDFDRVEHKNLNRIINATLADAKENRLKVEMFAQAVDAYRGPGAALAIAETIVSREAVLAVSQCDVIFSCVDTHEARQIADLIASAFLIPLFDVGVVIPTRKAGQDGVAIADVCGRIDYVQPGGSTSPTAACLPQKACAHSGCGRRTPTPSKRNWKRVISRVLQNRRLRSFH